MSAGLVTDNPWGDRQEAMTREEFAAVLQDGLGHVRRPGTGFRPAELFRHKPSEERN